MVEITKTGLTFSFQDVGLNVSLGVSFNRTLRIPDDGNNYPLPPGLGKFPLKHVDDYTEKIPEKWLEHGGVILPMYQSEALWIDFSSNYIYNRGTTYPFAIKVATGKINAVTGGEWSKGLKRNPQNYMVSNRQKWLDGYCIEKGVIKQFVAMPLGVGYSAEEQITGNAEFGGIQIEVFPMKKKVFVEKFPEKIEVQDCRDDSFDMGLAPGGRMRQIIYEDDFDLDDWDLEKSSRCFIHIANSMSWRSITGNESPSIPFTAREYEKYGLPWFEYYSDGGKSLEGSDTLGKLKTVKEMGEEKGDVPLIENQSVETNNIISLEQLPRVIGIYEDNDVIVDTGRFVSYIYIEHKSKYISLIKDIDEAMEIGLERAIELIEEKRKKDREKIIKTFKEDKNLQIINGRWGPYISYNKENYNIPKKTDAYSLTFKACKKIMEENENK